MIVKALRIFAGRALSALAVVLVFLASPLASWGSASAEPTSRCCCPSARVCKCHTHDGDSQSTEKLKRCSTGQSEISTIVLGAAVTPDEPFEHASDRSVTAVRHEVPQLRDKYTAEPETPPF